MDMKTSQDSQIIVPRADGLGYEIKKVGPLFKVYIFYPGDGWIWVNSLHSEAGAVAYGEQISRQSVDDRYNTNYAGGYRDELRYRDEFKEDFRPTMRPEYMR